ncbi:MAG: 50S ribosomal protein L10 [bacterium]
MPNPEKATIIDEVKEKINSAKLAILTDFQGMNVAEMTELRKLLRNANVDYKVYKNTLMRLAAKQLGINEIEKYLVGPTALAFGKSDDLVTPAKIIKDFSAKHQHLNIKAGILNKKVISPEDVALLTNIPPKEVLIAMVLGGLQAPVSKLLSVLQAPMREFIGVLKSLAEKREKDSGAKVDSEELPKGTYESSASQEEEANKEN